MDEKQEKRETEKPESNQKQTIFADHNDIKLEINRKKKTGGKKYVCGD